MNLLKKITIDGQIRHGYAHVTAAYTFMNDCDEVLLPRFLFPVPEGGRIFGFQLLHPEGRLLRASICPVTEENLNQSGISLRQLSPTTYCLWWEGMGPGEQMQILLELLLPLVPREEGVRFVFPLTGEAMVEYCSVVLNLYTGQAAVKGSSLSHSVQWQETGGETVVSAQFAAGRDLVLDLKLSLDESNGVIQECPEECIGIYRLRITKPELYRSKAKKRVLLLLDHSGIRELQTQRMLKELCYRVAQVLPAGMPVQIMAEKSLFEDFVPVGAETVEALFHALAECQPCGGIWELLENLQADSDTLVLLVSGGQPEGMPKLLQRNKPLPNVHLFTLGSGMNSPLTELWKRMGYGMHTHFYPEDVTEERVQKVIQRLLISGVPVQVTAANGRVKELFVLSECVEKSGYLDVAVRFTGQTPACFILRQEGEVKESVEVKQLRYYTHLPMAEKLYAGEKIRQLELLAQRTDAGTVAAIKKQIEELSLHYGVLSSEAILQIADDKERRQGIPVQFGFYGGEIAPRRTIFGERNGYIKQAEKNAVRETFLSVLRRSMRSNGAIYDADALTEKERAEQTAWAVLALLTEKEKDRTLLPVISSGETYLKGRILTGTVGWLYEKRNCPAEYKERLCAGLLTLDQEAEGVKAAAQGVLRIFYGMAFS